MRTAAAGYYLRPDLVLKFALVAAWATLVFVLSSLTSSQVQETSSLLAGLPFVHILMSPVFVHLVLYSVLAALAYSFAASLAYGRRRPYAWLATLVFCIAYGAGDELHQSFVPGRDMSLLDLGIDTLGALAGLGAAEALARRGRLLRAHQCQN